MHASSPDFAFSNSMRHLVHNRKVVPRRSSFSGAMPTFSKDVPVPKLEPNRLQQVHSNDESCDENYIIIEEILVDDASYEEEEIIELEEYYEEEEIEEEVVFRKEYPTRELKIKFDDYDEMQTALHINDYSAGEIEKSWYSRADYDKMAKKARVTVAKAETKEASRNAKAIKVGAKVKKKEEKVKKKNKETKKKDSEPCDAERDDDKSSSTSEKKKKSIDIRGLEGWTTSGSLQVREMKEKAVDAVWNEQNRQWTSGCVDVEKLRAAYMTVSALAQAMAEARAMEDRVAADAIHNSEGGGHKKSIRHNGLISKARRKVKKSVSKKKHVEEAIERRITRQPSRGSRLFLDDLDGRFIPVVVHVHVHGDAHIQSSHSQHCLARIF